MGGHGLDPAVWEKIKATILTYPGVSAATLFGSRATGRFRAGSDIDIALEGENLDLKDLNRISILLDQLMLPYQFDLVLRSYIQDPAVLLHITQFGVPLG